MDYTVHSLRLEGLVFFFLIFLGLFIDGGYSTYHYGGWKNNVIKTQLTKVQLTQKGYIQFLRYVEDVPSITEYTFCIWVKSYDLSNTHHLLSYSRNEKDRLIRVWISPRGKSINLELLGHLVFEIPTQLREHQWYHVCQSWDSATATWELFVNDKKFQGRATQLTGIVIKSGGDIVVAQEYTDFNKGLEDGVEGEIFGFNFVLSATSKKQKLPGPKATPTNAFVDYRRSLSYSQRPYKYPLYNSYTSAIFPTFTNFPLWWENPYSSSFNSIRQNNLLPQKTLRTLASKILRINPPNGLLAFPTYLTENDRFRDEIHKSTGLKLVEMSKNCSVGRGGPLRGENVLINWVDTSVRVFGGAIMKQVQPFC